MPPHGQIPPPPPPINGLASLSSVGDPWLPWARWRLLLFHQSVQVVVVVFKKWWLKKKLQIKYHCDSSKRKTYDCVTYIPWCSSSPKIISILPPTPFPQVKYDWPPFIEFAWVGNTYLTDMVDIYMPMLEGGMANYSSICRAILCSVPCHFDCYIYSPISLISEIIWTFTLSCKSWKGNLWCIFIKVNDLDGEIRRYICTNSR